MNRLTSIAALLVACSLLLRPALGQQHTARDGVSPGLLSALNAEGETSQKSVLIAVAMSLALPGMGELYVGKFESGKYHLLAEGGIWVGYLGMRSYSNWIRNDARAFATEHAGVQFSGKDTQFDVNIGDFNSLREYNEAMLKNRNIRLLYESASHQWEWDTESNRLRFRDLRIRSDRTNESAGFLIGAAVLNRIVSAFSAGRAAARGNDEVSHSWILHSGLAPHQLGGQSIVVLFSAAF